MAARRAQTSPCVANALLGLRLLDLRLDSDEGILHQWARLLSDGMFDGHGSVLPAPAHLIFHGIARCNLKTLFQAHPKTHKNAVASSLRDALVACGVRRTRVANARRDKVNILQIHEWAADLAMAPIACGRGLPRTLGGRPLAVSPVGAVLDIIDSLSALASATYFYARAELDGGRACRARYKHTNLDQLSEAFLVAVSKLCVRPDCDAFSSVNEAPNTDRFRDLMVRIVQALRHIRDSLELPLESLYQTLKRSIVRGNGDDDAGRAMSRYVDQEAVSRLSLDADVFGVPVQWYTFSGIRELLKAAAPLWTEESNDWACAPGTLAADSVPLCAQALADEVLSGVSFEWKRRCLRGASEAVAVGDSLASLVVASSPWGNVVPVATGSEAYGNDACVFFFYVCALVCLPCGQVAAIIQPYEQCTGRAECWARQDSLGMLRMQVGVRRAAALHSCDAACVTREHGGLSHGPLNRWHLLGRCDGYPSRSA